VLDAAKGTDVAAWTAEGAGGEGEKRIQPAWVDGKILVAAGFRVHCLVK